MHTDHIVSAVQHAASSQAMPPVGVHPPPPVNIIIRHYTYTSCVHVMCTRHVSRHTCTHAHRQDYTLNNNNNMFKKKYPLDRVIEPWTSLTHLSVSTEGSITVHPSCAASARGAIQTDLALGAVVVRKEGVNGGD
jgi:hypothetical protein